MSATMNKIAMRFVKTLLPVIVASTVPMFAYSAQNAAASRLGKDYIEEPMPAGFQIVLSDLEGPVFADANGKTFYRWPVANLRNGPAGEQKGKPTCDDTHYRVNAGLMSPYPPGLELPDVDTRLTCAQLWPPVLASVDSKPIGKWTVVDRKDGSKQWAYDGQAVYTSLLDHKVGDVLGGTNRRQRGEEGAVRFPIGPAPNVPPQFNAHQTITGRLLVTSDEHSVYVWDKDAPNKSNCNAACVQEWSPVLAPNLADSKASWSADWSVVERSPGVKQWAFKKQPLYIHVLDQQMPSLEGGDVPGWHNVYLQKAPLPPKEFTVSDTSAGGQVLADSHGKTIYIYYCNDDAVDQQACDYPEASQAYRFAICGRGDPERCLQHFSYVIASKDAVSPNHLWTTMDIDPKTGRRALAGQSGSLRVWAFRDRPVYNCYRDREPGDAECDWFGEHGVRNGFRAFWLRDVFGALAG